MSTAAIRRHWTRVAALGCIVSGQPAEIAHCHGGSLLDRGILHAKGKKLARYDWLVLPLAPRFHRAEYGGLDANVRAWERKYGCQTDWIDTIARRLNVNLWRLAGEPETPARNDVREFLETQW